MARPAPHPSHLVSIWERGTLWRKVPQLVSNHHAEAWLVVSPVRSPSCPKPGWASEPHHCSRSRGAPATQGNFPDLTFRLRLPPLPRPPLTLEIPVLWPFSQSGLHPRDGSLGSARPLSTRATRALKWPSSLRGRRCPGPATPAPTPPARAPGRRAREFGHCSPALAGGRPRPRRAAGDLAGADGRAGPRRGSAGGGGGHCGGSAFGLEGRGWGRGRSQSWLGPGSLPAANHRPASPSRPPRPLFPAGPVAAAAGRRSEDFRPPGPGPVRACAGPARGPPGLAVRRLARGLAHAASSAASGSAGSGQSALGGGPWLEAVGTEEHGTWAAGQPRLHLSFLGLAAALPVLRGFPCYNSFPVHPPADSRPASGCILRRSWKSQVPGSLCPGVWGIPSALT